MNGESLPLLSIRNLHKVYGGESEREVHALTAVDLDLPGGAMVGILGPNGAGKTTLLRICAALLAPTSGDVWVAGHHAVAEASRVRACLGYLSATTGIYERLTPREFMQYFGRLHGMSEERITQRTSELFARLDIDHYQHRQAGKLSTGMRQKVSIARAFLHDPPVLILDEPTNGLDVLVRESLIQLLLTTRRPGRLIIISTHDLAEAEQLCDSFVFIAEGRIVAKGSRDDILRGQGRSLREAFFEALGGDVVAN